MVTLPDEPLWYKDAIIYELHVKAFCDSDGDGIGDFRGLTEKLDYLEDLGINVIWLLPFYPSPLKDDGYDISDYFNIHRDYGTLRDFREFLKRAHERGIRVITELVINHTSDQHPWFERSRNAKPGSQWRNFYVWSDTPDKYRDARIIFQDFENSNWAWDPKAKAYYWHRFYSHQPDLNFDSPQVQKAVFRILDFWFAMGVDGLRLDAVPYLFQREGTNCENLPETYRFLKEMRTHVDRKFKNRMLLSEANQWPEDAAAYFGKGNITHMAFHFPLMPRMFIGLQMEDRFPIIDILEQTPQIPDNCQWALFLRNHDELTLEMVTDEERDYMYRVYARDRRARINLGIRRRLAPLVDNNRRRIELMNMLLFSLPGTPVIYYGDEIGMGDNYYLGDRNGVRTPMQWSPDRNAGFSRSNPQRLYMPVIIDPEYHYESLNVENQQRNPTSLLWWMKRVFAMRKRFKAFGRGTLEFLYPDNPKILAFFRKYEEETILVVANLSRYYQVVELDLSHHAGYIPVEIAGQNRFPVIKESPYILTLGPHNYLWLQLNKEEEQTSTAAERKIPELHTIASWETVLEGEMRRKLENEILPKYLATCRWFGGKAKTVRNISITEIIPIAKDSDVTFMLILAVQYTEGAKDFYLLAVSFAPARKLEKPREEELFIEEHIGKQDHEQISNQAAVIGEEFPQSIIAHLYVDKNEGILYDAAYDSNFRESLLLLMERKRRIKGLNGELIGLQGKTFRQILGPGGLPQTSQVIKAEQSNTSVLYADRFYLKLFRNLKEGINPDQEIVQYLTEKVGFPHIPPFAGSLEYRQTGSEPIHIGLLQGFVQCQSDAWTYTLDTLDRYFEQVLSRANELREVPKLLAPLLSFDPTSVPHLQRELIEGGYVEMAALLAKRTAEMHLALDSPTDTNFTPEPFSMLYQRSIYQSMRGLARQVFTLLKKNLKTLPKAVTKKAERILDMENNIIDQFGAILQRKFSAMKIRIHGDYHLGQVLFTGKDFIIIDFEGEPARSLTERRIKQSPLRDVAGMIRSFHYAAYFALFKQATVRPGDIHVLRPWTELWHRYISAVYLDSYLETAHEALFIPREREELNVMLRAFILEKAVYELGYELNNRPAWAIIPLGAISDFIKSE